jgi:hypothetical protein
LLIGLIAILAVSLGVAGLTSSDVLTPEAGAPAPRPADDRREPAADPTAEGDADAFTLAAPAPGEEPEVDAADLFAWALLDVETGAIVGSANSATARNTVESMIKPWIAADYLRRLAEDDRRPSDQVLRELRLVIVDSNDPLAEKYYQLGGADAVVKRLISRCGLSRVKITASRWSRTQLTPRDSVRYARCLADGRAAGPVWTEWVIDAMRDVRGDVRDQISGTIQGGRWGIIDGIPRGLAEKTAIKNGWTQYVDGWRVNCLAVHPEWALAVMLRIPESLREAAEACETVAEALVTKRPVERAPARSAQLG